MNRLLAWNRLRWYVRLPIKWAVFAFTVLAVCFPYPSRLVRHVERWRNPNALIEPDAPALLPLVKELRERLTDELSPPQVLQRVEQYVSQKIDYEWDWNTWGTADYLPTVTEAVEMGKEDCDGRAVVAASLLRNFGYNAQIVANFAHVWVKTNHGETMSPQETKAVVATEGGLRVHADALVELPRSLGYGVAVFPLLRELIVVGVMWWLLLRARGRGGVYCSLGGLAMFVAGLFFLRAGGQDYYNNIAWMQWAGLATFLAGFAIISCVRIRRVDRPSLSHRRSER